MTTQKKILTLGVAAGILLAISALIPGSMVGKFLGSSALTEAGITLTAQKGSSGASSGDLSVTAGDQVYIKWNVPDATTITSRIFSNNATYCGSDRAFSATTVNKVGGYENNYRLDSRYAALTTAHAGCIWTIEITAEKNADTPVTKKIYVRYGINDPKLTFGATSGFLNTNNPQNEMIITNTTPVNYSWNSDLVHTVKSTYTSNNPTVCGVGPWSKFGSSSAPVNQIPVNVLVTEINKQLGTSEDALNKIGCKWTITLTGTNDITLKQVTKSITLNYTLPAPTISLTSGMSGGVKTVDVGNKISYSWAGANATSIVKTVTTNNPSVCLSFGGVTTTPASLSGSWTATTALTNAQEGCIYTIKTVATHSTTGLSSEAQMNFTYPDRTKPRVTSFSATPQVSSHTVTIGSFGGTDANVPATGPSTVKAYLITSVPSSVTAAPAAPAAPSVADILNTSANISPWTRTEPSTFAASAEGAIKLYPWVVDAAGNVSSVATPVTVNVPTIGNLTASISRPSSQLTPTDTSSIQFLVTFNRAINASTFTKDDFTIVNGTVTNIAPVNGTNTYTVTVTATNPGLVAIILPAGKVTDTGIIQNQASTNTANTVVYVQNPGTVGSLAATPSNGQIALTWAAPANTGGSAITDYVVEFKPNAGGTWSTFQDTVSPTTGATITGLANGVLYNFRVIAKNILLNSSTTINATPGPLVPGAPTAFSARAGDTHISFSWDAPTNDGGAPIEYYQIRYQRVGGPDTWTTKTGSSLTNMTVSGLQNTTSYRFQVAAVNSRGISEYSVVPVDIAPVENGNNKASLVTNIPGANNDIVWTAKNAGTAGNDITITYAEPTAQPITTVTVVSGKYITITPGTKANMVVSGSFSTSDNGQSFSISTLLSSGTYGGKPYWSSDGLAQDASRSTDYSEILYAAGQTKYYLQGRRGVTKAVVYSSSTGLTSTDDPSTLTWNSAAFGVGTPIVNPSASSSDSASQVIAAVAANSAAAALVSGALASGNDGTGVATEMSSNLFGGDDVIPTVTTTAASAITQTTATSGGAITTNGGAAITASGIVWSTTTNPTTDLTTKTTGTIATGSFSGNMTELTAGTTYYVRAYATNSVGTSYGANVTFTTAVANTAPTLTTTAASAITQTTATSGGTITTNGGAAITASGIVWSTTTNPTTALTTKTVDNTATGSFSGNMTGLTAGTTYYVRAYATNSEGAAYGNQITFTTLSNVATYTVIYNGNGNTSGTAPADQVKINGTNLILATNTGNLVRNDHYSFAGWNTAANGSGTNYAAGATYNLNAALNLYAKWTLNAYDIGTNAGSNGAISPAQVVNHGASATFTVSPSAGYSIASVTGCGGTLAGTTYTITNVTGACTVNATFALNAATTYTVTFNSDGGSNVSSITGITPSAKIIAPSVPTKSGFTFVGWYKESALTNAWVFATDTVTADTGLYAKWTPIISTVTFNSNGGSTVASLTNVAYNTIITAPTAPTKAENTFVGWYKESALTNAWVFATDTVTADTGLYAKWTAVADTTPPTVTAFDIPATSTTLSVTITPFTASETGVSYLITDSATKPATNAADWNTTKPTSHTFTTAGSKTLYAWVKDAAGNVSTATVSDTVIITLPDTTPPTVSVTSSNTTPPLSSGETTTLTFTLSAASNDDFAENDVTVVGGTLTGWNKVSSTVYTALFTPASNRNTAGTINVAAGKFTSAANSISNTAMTQLSIQIDTVAPATPAAITLPTQTGVTPLSFYYSVTRDSFTVRVACTAGYTSTIYSRTGIATTPVLIKTTICTNSTTMDITDVNPGQANGSYYLSATITDTAGNTSNHSDLVHIYKDLSAAAVTAPGAPDLEAISDLGTSSIDNTTSETRPRFVMTCTAGNTVHLYDSANLIGSTTCMSGTAYAIPTLSLSAGQHVITAKQLNPITGVSSDASSSLTVTIDTTPLTVSFARATNQAEPATSSSIQFAATFSRSIDATSFICSDVTVTNGNCTSITLLSGDTYIINVTATAQGQVKVVLNAGRIQTLAGNVNAESTGTNIVTYGTTTATTTAECSDLVRFSAEKPKDSSLKNEELCKKGTPNSVSYDSSRKEWTYKCRGKDGASSSCTVRAILDSAPDSVCGDGEAKELPELPFDECTLKKKDAFTYYQYLTCLGITQSKSSCTQLRCGEEAKRQELVDIAVRIRGIPMDDEDYECQGLYSDVRKSSNCESIEKARIADLISSKNKQFRPLDTMTRAETFKVFLASICEYPSKTTSNWQNDVARAAIDLGFSTRTVSTFEPNKPILRQELYVLSARIAQYKEDNGDNCDELPEELICE